METAIVFISGTNISEPMVSSRMVAERFDKEHTDVLRALNKQVFPFISEQFSGRNFALATYTDEQGKPRKEIHMTKDGFMILAMGFTGEEAMKWKEAFIDAFNQALGSISELRNELARKESVILKLQGRTKKERRFMVPSEDHLEGFDPPLVSKAESELSPEESKAAKQLHVIKTLKGIIQKHIFEQGKQEKADLISQLVMELLL